MAILAAKKWLIADYAPVSLFSLRSTYATSKGGKTLLVPTPYAVKMALIDACFRAYPCEDADTAARRIFDEIKSLPVRIRPPADCIVENTFLRVLQPARGEGEDETACGPFTKTIAYREFVFFRGSMEVALGLESISTAQLTELENLLAHISYFGKRGCFWQFMGARRHEDLLPAGFSLTHEEIAQHPLDVVGRYRVPEYLDDFGAKLCTARDGFERVSTYHDGEIKLTEHRVLKLTLLPYERMSGGRHFTRYRRTV
jgi:hypothetical protein